MRTCLLLILPLAAAFLAIGAPTSSAMPKPAKPTPMKVAEPVVCKAIGAPTAISTTADV